MTVTSSLRHGSGGDVDNFRGGKCHGDSNSGGGYGKITLGKILI